MLRADIPRQRQFFLDPELAWLDCSTPEIYAATDVEAFFQARTRGDPDLAAFALEVGGTYVGHGSLMHLSHPHRSFELGIVIGDPDYQGRRFGRQVVRLLLEYGFVEHSARRIHLTTHEKNERAIRCYAACGFHEDGRPRLAAFWKGRYIDQVEMSILREEWISPEGLDPPIGASRVVPKHA